MSTSRHSTNPKSRMKSQSVSSRLYSAKTDSPEVKLSEIDLREQVRRLEAENSELRYRLDSLRKAKNQLIIKRDKPDYTTYLPPVKTLLTISTPKPYSPSPPPTSHSVDSQIRSHLSEERDELELRLAELENFWRVRLEETERNLLLGHEEEVKQLEKEKRQLRGELEQARIEKSELLTDFERKELKWLEELEHQESDRPQLAVSGEEYEQLILRCRHLDKLVKEQELRVDNLLAENSHLRRIQSQREEEWKIREEELSLEIRKAWGQRYHEWITKAEKKMQELQEMNQILQEMADIKVSQLSERKFSKQ